MFYVLLQKNIYIQLRYCLSASNEGITFNLDVEEVY